MYPESLRQLIEELKKLPGVGTKTAERYAMALLDEQPQEVHHLAEVLIFARDHIHDCRICHNLTEQDLCEICADQQRDQGTICVVAQVKDLLAIEKTGMYHGVYHVLGGLITPMKGIMPEDLNMADLYDRVGPNVREVILALNATVEGETTALYLQKQLSEQTTITRLAFGLPIGGYLDYADEFTLIKAFEGRK